ncbi:MULTISPECIES: LEA type 2 family protein [Winogradskyella]|uniref:NDR1/HIN1-like protein n=1 Tax=Winogradskyella TaxID=286104 RepID=UPI0015C8EE5C|nr:MULTISPECIES: LEA type 2 family protein [Winogradskyella]QXP78360.1 LEA type 2 family protein [Winogradskyella sp. HaHa_3_26]
MSKRLLMFSLIFTLLFNCSFTKKPEFVRLENIEVIDSNSKNITIRAEALFLNKNDVGGTLKTDDLKVYLNDLELASVISDEFDVPRRKNFTIPLTVKVATASLTSDKNLGSLLGSLLTQSLKLHYKGAIKYKIMGYSSTYTVNEIQDVKIKF